MLTENTIPKNLRMLKMEIFLSLRKELQQLMGSKESSSGTMSAVIFLEDQAMDTAVNSSQQYKEYSHRPETYIVPILFFLIFALGLLGNGTLIRIFYSHQSMRSKPNTFIMCLAVGDLMVMLGAVPFISFIYTFESWPFGAFLCKASEFFRDLSTGVTVFTLTMLSVDRYLAVSSPYVVAPDSSEGMAVKIIIALIWLLSTLLALPGSYLSFLMNVEVSDDKTIDICYPFPPPLGPTYPKIIVTLKFIIYYATPIAIIGVCYTLIALSLLREPVVAPGQEQMRKKRIKVVKMVFVLVIVFTICYLPNHLFLLWFYYTFPNSMSNYNTFWHILKILGYVLSFSNSCLNPLILYYISKKYRVHFRRYLFLCVPPSGPTLRRKPSMKLPSGAVRYRFQAHSTFSSKLSSKV